MKFLVPLVLVVIGVTAYGLLGWEESRNSAGSEVSGRTESRPDQPTPPRSSSGSRDARKYGVESAIIEYKVEGTLTGVETLIFDRYGAREVKVVDQELHAMGISQRTHTRTITEGDVILTLDLEAGTATRMTNPLADKLKGRDTQEMGEQMMKSMGGHKVGTEEVLGKRCDVWEIASMNGKTWIWNGITLRSDVDMGISASKTEAVKITLNPDLDAATFRLPAGVEPTEVVIPSMPGFRRGR